ncbi:DUF5925 domain-containing protein [Planctomycetota bacterium]|nr:DUF5925 domain-containing protein [Planctomycetota bacterium]
MNYPTPPLPGSPVALPVSVQLDGVADGWFEARLASAIEGTRVLYRTDAHDVELKPNPRAALIAAADRLGCRYRVRAEDVFEATPGKGGRIDLLLDLDDLVLLASAYSDKRVNVTAFCHDVERARETCARYVETLPLVEAGGKDSGLVTFAFWKEGARGPTYNLRDLECPAFSDVRRNYPAEVAAELGRLAAMNAPDEQGKIVLWHGPPGMGKSYAIRSLAHAWAEKHHATVEVVLDPERLFGEAGYMYSVLLDGPGPDQMTHQVRRRQRRRTGAGAAAAEEEDERPPLRLIVIEDGAELFSTNCRNTNGFSRFLNVSDGIVGQGLRCVFLLTANEAVQCFDPAVMRPGRCLQAVHFRPYTVEEAHRWLAARGVEAPADLPREVSLADLYALANGSGLEQRQVDRLGFPLNGLQVA